MRIAVFGATGTVGRHIAEQALARGYEVTALTRDAGRITRTHERLHIVEGDVLDPGAVERAVYGQDAVLVALGNGRKGVVRAEGTRTVIEAMNRTGVKRLICQSTLGAGDSRANLDFLWKYIMFGLLLRPAYADHQQQESHVRASDLEWTIVRPSAFTDGPRTGAYRRGFGAGETGLSLKIARADIAEFLLDQITDRTYVHRAPGISN
ncbi:SDR family oxidoreductase [Nocardia zapadnayensis]|uniref:NAD(P)-dependent oxidoreductase n=1 Tax=Nocardia rhamnosiphila TaxID=426716 RepID=UPI00224581BE|nr:SDR family oxidoreductase [Nocardia zapadnayensis]MCX0270681.1 SDR family oxidoreductase [Nocardia zapadnayensis]